MEAFEIKDLTFKYPRSCTDALLNISLTINEGGFVTVCGKSGSGKTTLLRQLVPSLSPHGERLGSIRFFGRDLYALNLKEQCGSIGFVSQSPENQIVTDKVWHELAFGLESLGIPQNEIRLRTAETASFFGIQEWFHKSTAELSGGQKQLLNLASVMTMSPRVLILDEPTSQLDPISAQDFFGMLRKINRELGVTVILSEHRLDEAFGMSDRVIVMDGGAVIADSTPSGVCGMLKDNDMLCAMPAPMRVYSALDGGNKYPVTVSDGRAWLGGYAETHTPYPSLIKNTETEVHTKTPAVYLKDVYFRYDKNSDDIIRGLNLKLYTGEIFALMGGNGTGKTTVLNIISGLNKPYRGNAFIDGKKIGDIKNLYSGCIGVLPQSPKLLFTKKTVREDLYEMTDDETAVNEAVRLCELEGLSERHPHDLSGGEQQRLALAKILLLKPKILLMDEPAKGMDAHFKRKLAGILNSLKRAGTAVVIVSHDAEFCAEYADRCALLFDGAIVSEGAPREFFAHNSFYTTSASRMARDIVPNAVTAEDIIRAFGGTGVKEEFKEEKQNLNTERKQALREQPKQPRKERHFGKDTLTALLMALIAVPLTIFAGLHFFEGRKYYFISLLIIFETLLPFMLSFEKRKPKARELVIISVLCALAVAGRAVFYNFPQFKPVLAVVIIAGVTFGCETGFMVGTVTAFVSNFFFGQGPWTPWQMFALGVAGFLAGLLFYRGLLPQKRSVLCIFGFAVTLVLYGTIMNISSVLMYQEAVNLKMLLASVSAGLPFDFVHALSTAVFLFLISRVMIEKIERVKTKYGIRQ